jgi:hypothetical protein
VVLAGVRDNAGAFVVAALVEHSDAVCGVAVDQVGGVGDVDDLPAVRPVLGLGELFEDAQQVLLPHARQVGHRAHREATVAPALQAAGLHVAGRSRTGSTAALGCAQ